MSDKVQYDKNDFIKENKIKDATILVCGKYGITAEEYYEIAKRFLNEML